ncbi:MAG: hypothetical protein ACXAD7_15455, partial [Candidatus Kariarchaeaceae archaeon]
MLSKTIKFIVLFTMLITGLSSFPIATHATTFSLPEVGDSNPSPTVDGNITAIEWQDSIVLNSTIEGQDASIRVVTTNSSFYIGFNYTTTIFVPVNDTVPVNSTLNYNNATHDWLALQIDNNLDQKDLGSISSPDDIALVDQYNSSYFDGYANGNTSYPVFLDLNNSGTNEGNASRYDYPVDGNRHLAYEFSKPISSTDINGSDFNLNKARILQFRLLLWQNSTANATFAESIQTEWFTLRVNESGTGIASKDLVDTKISVSLNGVPNDQFMGLETVLSSYGFDTVVVRENYTLGEQDLAVYVLGENTLETS